MLVKQKVLFFRILLAVIVFLGVFLSKTPTGISILNTISGSGIVNVQGLDGPVSLVRVSDGDTIVVNLNGKNQKLRLIGIDTPEKFDGEKLERKSREWGISTHEIKQMGKNSSKFTENLLRGKKLYLEYDVTKFDRYGRMLAYAYYLDENGDWTFGNQKFKQANLEIMKAGWAEPLTIPPNVRYAKKYRAANRNAKQNNLGNWANN